MTGRADLPLREVHDALQDVHAGVQDVALLQSGAQRAVQAVLEVVLALPPHDVGEQVTEERRVLVEQGRQLERVLGGHELVEPDLARRNRRPAARGQAVVGVGPTVAHALEDHAATIDNRHGHPRPLECGHERGSLGRGPPHRQRGRGRVRVRGTGARAGRADARRHPALRRPHPDPARDAEPARPGGRRDRHRQDQDPAADGRAAQRSGRACLRRRHQGRPLRPGHGRRAQREDHRAHRVGRTGLEGDGLPGGVLRARRAGHRHPAAGDHVGVRADPAEQGPRPQRHPGVEPRPGLPLRRQGRAAAARPRRPARGRRLPHQRRGQARPEGARRSVLGHRGRDPARADHVPGPRRRGVLRRARVRVRRSCCR